MNYPKISIITITYNSEKTLEETIKSVITQDYPNWEYLIIDGGSKDQTLNIIEKYRKQISLVISEPDKGISDAFNKGIKNATGEIIGIINSDDLLLPNALKTIANNYEPNVGVYRGNTIIWNDINQSQIIAYPTMKFSLYSLKKRIICHQSTFVKKDIYKEFGLYKESFKYMMDVDLLLRLYKNKVRFKYVDAELAVFRLGGVTNNSFLRKISEVKRLYVENGAPLIWTYFRVIYFIMFNCTKNFLNIFISPDTLRKWKFKLSK